MSDTNEQIKAFLDKCEELKKCKFIMATTKIKDLLKCIVNSPELYMLFESVTKDFDYLAAKSQCLITVNDGGFLRSYVVLPQTIGQRLAFIFCLFVDFDRDNVNFNDFLRKYFPEDGSYYQSYRAFCETFIDSLEDMLKRIYRRRIEDEPAEKNGSAAEVNSRMATLISEVTLAIANETHYLEQSAIPDEEKEGGKKMLAQLLVAVKSGDENLIDALICGYNYFVLYHKSVSDGIGSLIESLAEYEKAL